jgi:hypothetical protein
MLLSRLHSAYSHSIIIIISLPGSKAAVMIDNADTPTATTAITIIGITMRTKARG